jgi:phage FluMu gp28-like protein
VREAATAKPQEGKIGGRRYVMGVDLARHVDFTVIVVLDVTHVPYRMVHMDRFNQISWQVQVQRIKTAARRFDVDQVVVDQTGVGDPVIEQLRRELAL